MNLFASDLPGAPAAGDRTAAGSGQTPPPDRTPPADERIDLDDWGAPASPARHPRRWMLLAGVAPWVVVLAILVSGRDTPAARPGSTGASSPPAPSVTGEGSVAPSAAPTPATPSASPTDRVTSSSPLVAIGMTAGPSSRGRAVGIAVVAARTWLSTRPVGQAVDGLSSSAGAARRYVEHLVVESVDFPARGALVVTLSALVLPVEGESYGPAQQVRLAVPVSLDAEGARLAGAPWPLPVEPISLEQPATTPVDDPDLLLAATEALTAAGYAETSLTALERTDGWAWIAHVEARAPGHDDVRTHAVWLRSDVGRLVVAGAPAPPPPPVPSPTDQEATP